MKYQYSFIDKLRLWVAVNKDEVYALAILAVLFGVFNMAKTTFGFSQTTILVFQALFALTSAYFLLMIIQKHLSVFSPVLEKAENTTVKRNLSKEQVFVDIYAEVVNKEDEAK